MERVVKGKGFLRICGILMIIAGVVEIIFSGVVAIALAIISLVAVGSVTSASGLVSEISTAGSVIFIISAIIAIIGGILSLIAGIVGINNAARPERYKRCIVWGIIVLIVNVISIVFSFISASSFNMNWLTIIAIIFGVIIPVLFIIGALINRHASMKGQTSVDWARDQLVRAEKKYESQKVKMEAQAKRREEKLIKQQEREANKQAKEAAKQAEAEARARVMAEREAAEREAREAAEREAKEAAERAAKEAEQAAAAQAAANTAVPEQAPFNPAPSVFEPANAAAEVSAEPTLVMPEVPSEPSIVIQQAPEAEPFGAAEQAVPSADAAPAPAVDFPEAGESVYNAGEAAVENAAADGLDAVSGLAEEAQAAAPEIVELPDGAGDADPFNKFQ